MDHNPTKQKKKSLQFSYRWNHKARTHPFPVTVHARLDVLHGVLFFDL